MRKPWDEYWLDIADMVATRATCPRLHVGVVIVDEYNTIISTGYNGSAAKFPHCEDVGCLVVDNHCTRTYHAESNAIRYIDRDDYWLGDLTLYCTHKPCSKCMKIIESQSKIKHIKWRHDYP